MALLGQNAAATAAPQQQAPPPAQAAVPTGGAAPTQAASAPQGGMNPLIQSLMGQSQQALNAPMGQPVPAANPIAGLAQHPIVQALIKGIGQMAQGYGWTAMMPQEREERTQMQQQKAESLARLAETGAYQEGMLGIRGQQANTQQQRAESYGQNVESQADYRKAQEQNMQDRTQILQDANDWKKEMAAGRLDKAQQMIDQKATQFEQKLALQNKQFGLDKTKVELSGEGLAIKQGMLDLAKTALAQRGTVEGAQAMSKIQQFKIEHPIMSQFMDMSDLDQLIGSSGGAGVPGVAPVAPTPVQPTPTGVPGVVPKPSTTGKANAKRQQAGGGKPGDPLGLF